LGAVLLDRTRTDPDADPLAPLYAVLSRGESLIIFPEGTRTPEAIPGAFKSGLYHLAKRAPGAELVPVYLENLHRSMPKGAIVPVPVTCTVRFGAPLSLAADEPKDEFLRRAREAVIALSGKAPGGQS
jgi:1-acyl-sn-glycerol-3-phosphate acyltransferase